MAGGVFKKGDAERPQRRLRGRAALTVLIGLAAAGAVAMTTMAALGAFSATITQNGTLTSGTIVLKEVGSSNTCYSAGVSSGTILGGNSYSCTTIDTFGAPTGQLPGGSTNTQTLTFTNVGTANAATFTITPGTCTASGTGTFYGSDTAGFCGKVDVTIGNGAAVCYYPSQASACPAPSSSNTLAGLTSALTIGSGLAAGASDTIVVSTKLDASATNNDQGLQASQGFTFTITQ
jgi:hypothetical protein